MEDKSVKVHICTVLEPSYISESRIYLSESTSRQSSGKLQKIHNNSIITGEIMLVKVIMEKGKGNSSIN